MAPECPRSLVILDFSEPEALDGGTVYHWDPVNPVNLDSELAVLWEAARCPGGFVEAVANVACVAVPPGYTEYRYALERPREPLVESWRGQPRGGILMVIASDSPAGIRLRWARRMRLADKGQDRWRTPSHLLDL